MLKDKPLKHLSLQPTFSDPPPFFKTMYRPCWVEVSLGSIRRNILNLRGRLAPGTAMMAVVKANAYGHGLLPVARLAVAAGAAYLGVSSLEEGAQLRKCGITDPVLVLGSLFPFDSFPGLFKYRLTPTVASLETATALDALARLKNKRLPVHLKIDSGFGRIGVSIPSAREFIQRVARFRGLKIEGLYTHFSSSDVDADYTRIQASAFNKVVKSVVASGIRPPMIHLANSAAIFRFPETHGTLVRPGLALYGIAPYEGAETTFSLEPALAWKTRVIFIKQVPKGAAMSYARTWIAARATRVATLAVGYADGYPRLLSNKAAVLIHGRRAAVIGRVTMDMMMVDVTDVPLCRVGDEVVLIGAQSAECVTAVELAQYAQTNAYEILCRIGPRVPRKVLDGR